MYIGARITKVSLYHVVNFTLFPFWQMLHREFLWLIFFSKLSYNGKTRLKSKNTLNQICTLSFCHYLYYCRPLPVMNSLKCVIQPSVYFLNYVNKKWIYLFQELQWFNHVIVLKNVLYCLIIHRKDHFISHVTLMEMEAHIFSWSVVLGSLNGKLCTFSIWLMCNIHLPQF